MSRTLRIIAAVAVGLVSPAGCGSRTGLDATRQQPAASSRAGGAGDGGGGGSDGGAAGAPEAGGWPAPVICSQLMGPVSSCVATPQTGTVWACNANFPHCVVPPQADFWQCCNGQAQYDGPGGNCGGFSPCPLVEDTLALGDPASTAPTSARDCLSSPLPVVEPVLPDCLVFAARLPSGSASAADVAACASCSDTGLGPVPPGLSPASVNSELAGYACVCVVKAVASCPGSDAASAPAVSWCYDADGGGGPSCSGPSLGFTAPAGFAAKLYVQCLP